MVHCRLRPDARKICPKFMSVDISNDELLHLLIYRILELLHIRYLLRCF